MLENLSSQLKIEFLVSLKFGQNQNTEESYIDSAINAAYLDFNRTIHGYSKANSSELHSELMNLIKLFISDLRSKSYTESEFNREHSSTCNELIHRFNEAFNSDITLNFGQAQKWVNMSLKYVLTLTLVCPALCEIERNYEFFHVPIDSVVLKDLSAKKADRWSRIDESQYLEYQRLFKDSYPNIVPIVKEFSVWNTRVPNSGITLPL